MCPLLAQLKIGFFSSFSAAAVYSTNEANKAGLKQSIIFRCLWLKPECYFDLEIKLIRLNRYGKPHGYSSKSDSTRETVVKQTSPKINRLC